MKDVNKLICDKNGVYCLFDFGTASVICAFSNKRVNMSFTPEGTDNNSAENMVIKNRNNFCQSLGVDYKDLVCLKQVHGNHVVEVGLDDKGKGATDYCGAIEKSDGAITAKTGVPIGILTADCIPLFFYDSKEGVVGIAHAGWKGVQREISKKIITLMQNKYKIKPSNLLVGIGPAVRSCCYEVSEGFKKHFPDYLIYKKNRIYCDLIKAIRNQLLSSGIKVTNIIDSNFCTSCFNNRFFSYRKEKGTTNRIMSLVMLK